MRIGRLKALGGIALGMAVHVACGGDSTSTFSPKGAEQESDASPSSGLLPTGAPGADGEGSKPVCGNGAADGTESCDDGNAASGDGCSSTCAIEAGYECPVPGAACLAVACGDGIVAGDEDCDDGNNVEGDGCSP